jgi:hypothetical protein
MKTMTASLAVLAIAAVGAAAVLASDRVAVYARIDKVVLEPDADAPERIQVWGVFAIAQRNDPNGYDAPSRGYLYFAHAGSAEQVRREWADLKSVAGTGQIVAFGSRFEGVPHLHQAKEQPSNPDRFATNVGLTKISGHTTYGPIRALLDFKP